MLQHTLFSEEIFRFLATCTIKNSSFAASSAKDEAIRLNVAFISRSEYATKVPYYINLQGNYSIHDEVMFVNSFDTGTPVAFTKETLALHPKTYFAYRIGGENYTELVDRYPTQADLIKAILYPVMDIEAAIDAPNFTLLNYDATQVEEQELGSILDAVTSFLAMFNHRWNVKEFAFEDFYPMAQWSMMWTALPTVILGQRIQNLRTTAAHSTHIWEYLTSKGLGDYRNLLTHRQQMFLYRNINYLIANRGKQSTLELLAEELLKPYRITLLAKQVIQQTGPMAERQGYPVTAVISSDITENDTAAESVHSGYESLDYIVSREVASKLEPKYSSELVASHEQDFGRGNSTWLPTKLVELNRKDLYTASHDAFVRFATQTILYKQSLGQISYNTIIRPLNGDLEITLTAAEAMALTYYCSIMAERRPVLIYNREVYRIPQELLDEEDDVLVNDISTIAIDFVEDYHDSAANYIGATVIFRHGDQTPVEIDEGNVGILFGRLFKLIDTTATIAMVGEKYNPARKLVGETVMIGKDTLVVTEQNYATLNGKIARIVTPVAIPLTADLTLPFKPYVVDLVDTFVHHGNEYRISNILNLPVKLGRIGDTAATASTDKELLSIIDRQFSALWLDNEILRSRGEQSYHQAHTRLYDQLTIKGSGADLSNPSLFPLNLGIPHDTFEEWFESNSALKGLMTLIHDSSDISTSFDDVAMTALKSVVNFGDSTSTIFEDFRGESFVLMRKLFIQLCSYNIAFVDTTLNLDKYLQWTPIVMDERSGTDYEGSRTVRLTPAEISSFEHTEIDTQMFISTELADDLIQDISNNTLQPPSVDISTTHEVVNSTNYYDFAQYYLQAGNLTGVGSIQLESFVVDLVVEAETAIPAILGSMPTDAIIVSHNGVARLISTSDPVVTSSVGVRKLVSTDLFPISQLNMRIAELVGEATDETIVSIIGVRKLRGTNSDLIITSYIGDGVGQPAVLLGTPSDPVIISSIGIRSLVSTASDSIIISQTGFTVVRASLIATPSDSVIISSLGMSIDPAALIGTPTDAIIVSSLGIRKLDSDNELMISSIGIKKLMSTPTDAIIVSSLGSGNYSVHATIDPIITSFSGISGEMSSDTDSLITSRLGSLPMGSIDSPTVIISRLVEAPTIVTLLADPDVISGSGTTNGVVGTLSDPDVGSGS